ncbi:hypothetical protein [Micromonospora sp. NPDC048839]|uniref:DUF7178 family protein n=1 Tax=Micromonospora sp. NPDC048839 TaxID=3155641 RepID=UPI0033FDC955
MPEMTHDQRLRLTAGTNIRATADRIVTTWNRATDTNKEAGARWYSEGEQFIDNLAAQTGRSRELVAAVVAHLSPRTTWKRNLFGATMLLTTGEAPTCMSNNVDRARRAMDADRPLDTLNGPKTRRFAANLLGDRESVTVDMWAVRVALGQRDDSEQLLARVGVYDALEHAYRTAARRIGVDPVTAQATTWIVARNGRAA